MSRKNNAQYSSTPPKRPPSMDKPKDVIGIVIADRLNVRSSATTDDHTNILGTIPKDTQVRILSTVGSFYEIETKAGDEGYCMSSFIKLRGIDDD